MSRKYAKKAHTTSIRKGSATEHRLDWNIVFDTFGADPGWRCPPKRLTRPSGILCNHVLWRLREQIMQHFRIAFLPILALLVLAALLYPAVSIVSLFASASRVSANTAPAGSCAVTW